MRPARRRTTLSTPLRAAAAAVAIIGWLALTARDGISPLDVLAGTLAVAAGALLLLPSGSAPTARGRRPERAAEVGESPGEPVPALLEFAAAELGLRGLVVWESLDGELVPVQAVPAAPPPRRAEGDPLTWVVREAEPLRMEPREPWPAWPATALPLDPVPGRGGLVLTAEAETEPPDPRRLAPLALALGSLLARDQQEAEARDAAVRFDTLLSLLRQLPATADPKEFPGALAAVAVEIARARGGVVATWQDGAGQVVARVGQDGGPAEGTYFGVNAGDLALAARAGATLRRERSGARARPLAEAGERWAEPPRHTAVVPLRGFDGDSAGVVALWGDAPPAQDAIEILEALGPLLTLQLRHAGDLVRFRQQAHEDPLTGLRNRAALEADLEAEVERYRHGQRRPLATLVLDLDRFKRINDTHGHAAGDAVLRRVSDVIRSATREGDRLARFGGEEFVVLLPGADLARAAEVAERIRIAVAAAVVEWSGTRIPVTLSIGVSACPDCVDEPTDLLESADQALYHSKETGRNRVTTAPRGGSGG